MSNSKTTNVTSLPITNQEKFDKLSKVNQEKLSPDLVSTSEFEKQIFANKTAQILVWSNVTVKEILQLIEHIWISCNITLEIWIIEQVDDSLSIELIKQEKTT